MKRYLYDDIVKDLSKKMVFLTGPRQVGKTFLAKEIMKEFNSPAYLNFDDVDDARIIRNRQWPISADLIVLDELHKMENWKQFIKGTYDTKPNGQTFLITGSARLDTFRQGGDSLAGRYFHYRLNPFSLKEVSALSQDLHALLRRLIERGGFPEPFLAEDERDVNRWRLQYYTDLIREDILDFSRIHEVRAIRLLLELLRSKVGAPLSYTSLAEDLQVAPNTVKKYLTILQSLYIVFPVYPYHKNVARALQKRPKIYFYDTGYVRGDDSLRFENLVAISLLKHVQYLYDAKGKQVELYYLRDKDGREIDFVLAEEGKMILGIEVKLNRGTVSKHLQYYRIKFKDVRFIQVILNLGKGWVKDGVEVIPAVDCLMSLEA